MRMKLLSSHTCTYQTYSRLFHSVTNPLKFSLHSPVPSFSRSLTYPLAHLLNYSRASSPNHSFAQPLSSFSSTHSLFHSTTPTLAHSVTHQLNHSATTLAFSSTPFFSTTHALAQLNHSFAQLPNHYPLFLSFTHSIFHSTTHSFIHSTTPPLSTFSFTDSFSFNHPRSSSL